MAQVEGGVTVPRYDYYDMDQVIAAALDTVEKEAGS